MNMENTRDEEFDNAIDTVGRIVGFDVLNTTPRKSLILIANYLQAMELENKEENDGGE